eukprot:UN28220
MGCHCHESSSVVTGCHGSSPVVTGRHRLSRVVTGCHKITADVIAIANTPHPIVLTKESAPAHIFESVSRSKLPNLAKSNLERNYLYHFFFFSSYRRNGVTQQQTIFKKKKNCSFFFYLTLSFL